MIFHENRLLADDSHVISYLIFSKLGKMSGQRLQNSLSAAVVIGALRVNRFSGSTRSVCVSPFVAVQ